MGGAAGFDLDGGLGLLGFGAGGGKRALGFGDFEVELIGALAGVGDVVVGAGFRQQAVDGGGLLALQADELDAGGFKALGGDPFAGDEKVEVGVRDDAGSVELAAAVELLVGQLGFKLVAGQGGPGLGYAVGQA